MLCFLKYSVLFGRTELTSSYYDCGELNSLAVKWIDTVDAEVGQYQAASMLAEFEYRTNLTEHNQRQVCVGGGGWVCAGLFSSASGLSEHEFIVNRSSVVASHLSLCTTFGPGGLRAHYVGPIRFPGRMIGKVGGTWLPNGL